MAEEIKTKQEVIDSIIEFFEDNDDVFISCIEDLDSYNGYLGDDRIYEMYELDELFSGEEPTEILRRAFYGYDAETWHTDSHGQKEYGAFNPNREYFYYNGYGNFVSCWEKDYSDHLDHYAIESMAKHRKYIWAINENAELKELFDALEETGE